MPPRALIEGLLDAVWLVDPESLRIVAANAACGTLLAVDATSLCGQDMLSLAATPEDMAFWQEAALGWADSVESHSWVRRADGELVAVLRRVSRVMLSSDKALFMVVMHDRSSERRAEDELADRLAELAATLESTHDGILVTDTNGRIRNFNQRFAALWELPDSLMVQRDDDAILSWMLRRVVEPAEYMRRLAAIDGVPQMQASDTVTLIGGRVLERVTLPQCSRGKTIGRVYSFRDISERLEANRRIETLSHTDALTGLPNRRTLLSRIDYALALAQREGVPFALLFLNLDRFKHINDTLGHSMGDRVLIEVAERLLLTLRQVDTVARLGADEYVLLVHQADAAGAEGSARRVLDAMQRPFTLDDLSFTVTCSVGISLHPGDGSTADEMLQAADAAMNEARESGRAGFRFHQARAESTSKLRTRMKLDHAMRQALAAGRFRLHYQPQVELKSGEIVGAEALIRWRDPELGDVPPVEFIPVAERSGFIVSIGSWVLRQAVQQAALWREQGRHLLMSINVSALQFQQADFVDSVARALAEVGLDPQWLELELTESILIQDAQEALHRLQALAELGVKLAIDDFGTGYSSLAYLKRFPISRLKIDRSFIQGLPGDESDAGIVRAIANMARALRLELIAEGVESEAQRQFMLQVGCEQYQGFLTSPAIDVVSFEAMLDRRRLAATELSAAPNDTPPH
ncbi:MAG: diguanylate cyclase [Burkholderiales bacterium PBB1]|nr:MAG: diguanylate cyclase [Burkholderiales bacterium PBB1]